MPLAVRLRQTSVPYVPPPQAYLELARTLGAKHVYLLESLSGPQTDNRTATVGFDPLVTITIKNQRAKIAGHKATCRAIWQSLAAQQIGTQDARTSAQKNPSEILLREDHELWDFLRAIQVTFAVDHPAPGSYFGFGFFGYFGYDTVRYVERLPRLIEKQDAVPDIHLVIYRGLLSFDLVAETCQMIIADSDGWPAWDAEIIASCLARASHDLTPLEVHAPQSITDSITQDSYCKKIEKALHYIQIGDIYQVQVGHQLTITTPASPLQVYTRLRARNPAPYMFLADFDEVTVVGASPEVFVRIQDDLVTMRPLAGTIARGKNAAEDEVAKKTLREDQKEVAEHVMLVDLCRNDIGRICKTGSLRVDALLQSERYSHVFHLVSNVTGRKREDADAFDVIAATFPAGTMTGAPKVRAMEIIEELETARRGLYAGALGLIDFAGFVNTALCIRAATYTDGQFAIRASAGVVADSQPEKEWQETLSKLSAGYWAITGKEIR
ncbi:MAG: anthranilate synthase component I family protein [Pseudomonadota bacterium]